MSDTTPDQELIVADHDDIETGTPYLGEPAEGAYPARPFDEAVAIDAAAAASADELKAQARELGLATSGTKADLTKRIAAHHAATT